MTDLLSIVWSSRLRAFLPEGRGQLDRSSSPSPANTSTLQPQSTSGSSTPTSSLSSTISPLSHTDKILLPPSTLQNLLSQISNDASLLPSPLLFKLTNPLTKKITHVGVREFSADEGTVQLPLGVARNLGLQNSNDLVLVNLVSLPKGTSLTLKVNTTGSDGMDWKSLLESRLHGNFTALTKGDVLTISHPSVKKTFDFTIEKLEPDNKSNAVCIIDTDLDLDVIEVSEDGERERALPGVIGSSNGNRVKSSPTPVPSGPVNLTIDGEPVEVNNLLAGGVRKFVVEVKKSDLSGSLVISPENISIDDPSSILIFVGIDEHNTSEESFLWSNLKSPNSSVRISSTDPYLPFASSSSVTFYILIRSDLSTTSFSLRVSNEVSSSSSASSSTNTNNNLTKCSNCHQLIPSQSLLRHTAFCERNNLLCPDGCGKVFSRREGIPSTHWHCQEHEAFGDTESAYSLHTNTYHTPISCQGCERTFSNLISLAQHKSTDCPGKLHICKFCHLLLPQEEASPVDTMQGFTGHESYCGNRTTDCEICKRAVRLKELQSHLNLHKLDRSNEPTPIICSNINCPRLVSPSSRNALDLCGICYGPLHSTLLDSTGSKLKQRIERRYVIQLTRGCGKPWCMNEYCLMTRPQKRSIAEIISTDVKLLLEKANTNEFSFCVDETATKRQLFVQFESQNGVHSPNICAKAIDEARGNESEARRWLQLHT